MKQNTDLRMVFNADMQPKGVHPGTYNVPTVDEVAAIIPSADVKAGSRYVVLQYAMLICSAYLQHIHRITHSCMCCSSRSVIAAGQST